MILLGQSYGSVLYIFVRVFAVELFLYLIIAVLIIVIIALVVKIVSMQKSLDNIASDFAEIIKTETNGQIMVNSNDKHIRELALTINKELKNVRSKEIKYIKGNDELKNAVVNISHDLRTPLTAINGYLDLLEQEEKTPAVEKYISIIGERVEALKSLTEELFKYSIVTSTIDEFAPLNLTLNSELETSLAGLYGAFIDKKIEPVVVIPEERIERVLDHKSLQRIFSNILGNALKYSEGDLYVELKTTGEIIFKNKASNMTAVDVGKLFDRFFTVESARHSTGLGLSIAKLLTEKNGGTIDASHEDGFLVIKLKF